MTGFRISNGSISTESVERSSSRSEVVNPGIPQDRRDLDDDAADENLMEFCKPIEFYNIMKHRFTHLPFFLPRSLSYKIDAARLKRIKMKVSVTACLDANGILPKVVHRCGAGQVDAVSVYVMPTIPLLSSSMLDYWFELGEPRVLKAPLVKSWSEDYGFRDTATFRLPDIRKVISRAKKDGAVVLFLIILESDAARVGKDSHLQSLVNCSGRVLWAKLPMSTLSSTWGADSKSNSTSTKEKAFFGTTYQVDLQNATLQHGDSGGHRGIKLSIPMGVSARNGVQLKLCISGLQVSQTISESGPVNCFRAGGVESPSQRFRTRPDLRVVFHFQYGKSHIVQQIQETDPFSCPICLVSCCSFKGLRYHLNSCHDLFNFEYLTYENSYLVVVSIRDGVLGDQGVNWRVVGQDQDTKAKMFSYVSRRHNRIKQRAAIRRRLEEQYQQHCENLESGAKPEVDSCINDRMCQLTVDEASATAAHGDDDMVDSVPDRFSSMHLYPSAKERLESGSQLKEPSPSIASSAEPKLVQPPQLGDVIPNLQRLESVEHGGSEPRGGSGTGDDQDHSRFQFNQVAEKSRKVSAEKLEARNRAALGKQQFYHSHTAQPMALEEVLSADDSEGEVDEEIAAIEDRRLLDEFVDVQADEKELMHMWNCFVSKQRVIADGHCPWACEAFAKFHASDFAMKPSLRWCMLMLLIKLWNHQLVDGGTIHACLRIIDKSIEAAAL